MYIKCHVVWGVRSVNKYYMIFNLQVVSSFCDQGMGPNVGWSEGKCSSQAFVSRPSP
jgi:hypothetical protein